MRRSFRIRRDVEPRESTRLMIRTPLVRAVGAGALLLLTGLAFAAPADRIYRTTGGRAVVVDSVTSDQWDEVKYKKGANDLNFPGMTVRSIEYGDTPESFHGRTAKARRPGSTRTQCPC
jgi:hypothetical protein